MNLYRFAFAIALAACVFPATAKEPVKDKPTLPVLRLMAQPNGDRVEWWIEETDQAPGCKTEDIAVQRDWRTNAIVRRACIVVQKRQIILLWLDGEFQETSPLQWIRPL